MNQRKYWVGLSMVKGLGPIYINKLLQKYKRPSDIWEADDSMLKMIDGIGQKRLKKINEVRKNLDLDLELEKLAEKNIKFLTLNDEDYPGLLRNIYDPPPVLYYKGQEIFSELALAVIGSRRATVYGRKTAKRLAGRLAGRGITIVSGMARGIDSAGHRGALRAEGKTIAVLGSGIDYIYPPENGDLYEKIQSSGAVISEFPPGVKPVPGNFPRRNRIISGLAKGIIVVEAAKRSGALITTDFALEQGREVFAVPGNIDRSQSRGVNNLIKEGAVIVTEVDDILEELFLYNETEEKVEKAVYPELDKNEMELLEVFKREPELYFDQLYEITNFNKNKLSSYLLKMELKGLIKLKPGKKYVFKGLQKLLKPL